MRLSATSGRVYGSGGAVRSLLARALSAIRRNGGTLLLPGAATPVLGEELLPSADLTTWVSGGAFGNWFGTTATADTITTTGVNGSRRIRLACTPGTTYWFSARVMGGTGFGSVAIAFGTSAAVYITHKNEAFVADGTVGALLTAPANAAFVEFCVRGGNTGQTATFAEFRTGVFSGYTHGNPALSNYLDSAGTDLLDSVTQVDQPVGLVLDSMGGVLGSELVPASYSGSVTGSWVISPASITRNGTTSTACSLALLSATSAAKAYQVAFVVSGLSGDAFTVNMGGANVGQIASDGAKTFVVSGGGAGMGFVPWSGTAGQVTITSISVREIPGNHATQPTPASKPLLRRGLVNQLLWSGGFTNAAWQKALTTLGASTADPNGGTSATIAAFAYGGTLRQNSIAWTAGTVGTIAVWVRKSTSGGANAIRLTTNNTAAWNTGITQKFTLTAEWQLVVMSGVLTSTGTTLSVVVGGLDAGASGDADCVGNVDIYRAALFNGTVTASEILAAGGIPTTTTAPASSERGRYSWGFDGSNDFLQTGITTGNEGWVCAGVTPGVNAIGHHIFGNGASSSADVGVWLRIPPTNNTATMLVSNGVIRDIAAVPVQPAFTGAPKVIEGGWNASTALVALDGVEASVAKTANCTTTKACTFGGSPTVGWYLNGPMPAAVYCPVLPSAADRALIRRFVGSLQGQTL